MGRAPCCDKANVKKGAWSPEEDEQLKQYIEKNGTGANWIALPQKAGLRRCGKSCRLRWLNYLRPNLKHGEFSDQEDRIICSLFSSIGSRWSVIAAQLPGRTDNDIKNYWNTKLKKKIMAMAPSTKYRTSTHDNQATDNNLLLQTSSVYECTNLITTPNIAFSRSDQYHHDQPIIPNFTTLISPKFSNENPLSIQPQLDEYMGFMKNGENDIFFGFGGGNNGSCSSSDEQISHGSVDENLCFQSYFSNGVGEIQDQDQQKLLISGNNHDIGCSSAAVNDENQLDNYSIEEIKQLISSTNYNVCNNLNFFVDDMMIKIEDNVLLDY